MLFTFRSEIGNILKKWYWVQSISSYQFEMGSKFDLESISKKIDQVNQKLASLESKSLEIENRQDMIDSLAYAYLFKAEVVLSKVNTFKEIEILQQLHVSQNINLQDTAKVIPKVKSRKSKQ